MTADAAEIVRLAERVEQATGPDRELDGSIAWAIGEFNRYQLGPDTTVSFHRIDKSEQAEVHVIGTKGGRVIYTHDPLRYTASLDAAMTLVPEGWRMWTGDFSIEGRFVWMLCGPKQTWITHEDGSREGGDDWHQSGVAATPALALTAAALRARAAQHDHEVG